MVDINKKTALDDGAELYKKRGDSSAKVDFSSMTKAQKWQYFKDYYLKLVLAAIAVVILAGSFLYTTVFHRTETVLTIAIINDDPLMDTSAAQDELRSYFGLTSDRQVFDISVYNLEDERVSMKFTTMMAAQTIDVIVADREFFDDYATQGIFRELSSQMPDSFASGDAVYGVPAGDSSFYQKLNGGLTEPYAGIVDSSVNGEAGVKFMEYLMGK